MTYTFPGVILGRVWTMIGSVARIPMMPYYLLLQRAADYIGLPVSLALVTGARRVVPLAVVRWVDGRYPVLGMAYPWIGRLEARCAGRVIEAIVRQAGR